MLLSLSPALQIRLPSSSALPDPSSLPDPLPASVLPASPFQSPRRRPSGALGFGGQGVALVEVVVLGPNQSSSTQALPDPSFPPRRSLCNFSSATCRPLEKKPWQLERSTCQFQCQCQCQIRCTLIALSLGANANCRMGLVIESRDMIRRSFWKASFDGAHAVRPSQLSNIASSLLMHVVDPCLQVPLCVPFPVPRSPFGPLSNPLESSSSPCQSISSPRHFTSHDMLCTLRLA